MGATNGTSEDNNRRTAWVCLVLVLLLQIGIFYPTYWSMVEIWYRSETFAHGFFIFPISLFLIWSKRKELERVALGSNWRALVVLSGLGFGWLLARLADVQVIQQFAVVSMLPVLVWLILGLAVVRAIAFPLAFLLFAVPVGEFLIYPMMEFTASFTVNAVRLSGIPVYWEGMFFTLPSGRWSIVEGCSGVRYIIASVTLGALYAYLTYHSYWRRAIFIGLSVIFPIFANGLRAYMIVMIGHTSEMKLATGVDHLIYGWVWFGIVMFFLFWLGSFWRDDKPETDATAANAVETAASSPKPIVALIVLVLLSLWPLWAMFAMKENTKGGYILAVPAHAEQWTRADSLFTNWQPRYIEPSQVSHTAYSKGLNQVGLFLAYYDNQKQGRELINSQNVMIEQKHPVWQQPYQTRTAVDLSEDKQLSVTESQLKSSSQSLLTWHWDYIAGQHLTNDTYAKLLEAWTQISGQGRRGTGIVLYTAFRENELESARARLKKFVNAVLPELEQRLAN